MMHHELIFSQASEQTTKKWQNQIKILKIAKTKNIQTS